MTRPRVSIARMMAVVMVLAIDCALIRLFARRLLGPEGVVSRIGSDGLPGIGLAISAGVLGWLLARGRVRRFAIGITLASLAAGALRLGLLEAMVVAVDRALVWFFMSTLPSPDGVILNIGTDVLLATCLAMAAMALGLVLAQARGRVRRFAIGITLASLCWIGLHVLVSINIFWYQQIYERFIIERLGLTTLKPKSIPFATGATYYTPSLLHLLVLEAAMSLPVFVIALAGGLLSLAVRRSQPQDVVTGPDQT